MVNAFTTSLDLVRGKIALPVTFGYMVGQRVTRRDSLPLGGLLGNCLKHAPGSRAEPE